MSGPLTAARRQELKAAAIAAGALVVLGVLLGVAWQWWAPERPRGLIVRPGAIQVEESESWIGGDGRYLVLVGAAGLLSAVVAWSWRSTRGLPMLLALALGGTAGAGLTWLVGRVLGGGTDEGRPNTIIDQLPLTVHIPGLMFLQAGLAVLVYAVLVSFTAHDDLGRPDPAREQAHAARAAYQARFAMQPVPPPLPGQAPYPADPSVGAGGQPQYGGGDGNAPGRLQQRDLPPQ
ncbi:hypothetical protein [Jatrophihabitans fulvus]